MPPGRYSGSGGGCASGETRGKRVVYVRTDLGVAETGAWHTFHALKRSVLFISVGYTVPLCGGGS